MRGFNEFMGGLEKGRATAQQRQSAFDIDPGRDRSQQAQSLAKRIADMDMAERQSFKEELSRKSQIAAALSTLPADQQVIGIQTYGKEFGIDEAVLRQAAAKPAEALARFAAAVCDVEMMLDPSRPEARPHDGAADAR